MKGVIMKKRDWKNRDPEENRHDAMVSIFSEQEIFSEDPDTETSIY